MFFMKISEKLKHLPKDKIENIKDLQGNLKDLSETDFNKLDKSIQDFGFFIPFFVWIDNKGDKWTVDGHQRKRYIESKFGNDFQVPYFEIEAKTLGFKF